MVRAKLNSTVYNGLLTVAAVLGVSLAALGGTQAAFAATTTYTLKALSATVNGTSVSAAATVAASTQTTAQYAGICVRDASDNNLDYAKKQNAVITTAGTALTGEQKTFAPGTYSYFVCLQVKNVWYQAGSTKTFTVADPGSGTGGGSGGTTTPPAGSSYGNNALAAWNTALVNRATQPVTWVAWGDSFTEGQGASSIQNRWVDKTLTSLRGTYPTTGVTGGLGYLPSFYETYGPDSTWTPYSAAGGSQTWIENQASLGNRIVNLNRGGYETYTVTGTSADVLYATGGGTFTYKVDSGSAVTVNTAGTYSATGHVHVTFPASGSHKVTITSTNGTVHFEGITAFNGDESKGIRLYEAGHSGATTGDFLATAPDMAKITDSVKADLVTIELGPNDFLHGPQTPANVTANLQSMVSAIRQNSADHQPSIVIVVPWDFSNFNGDSPTGYTWQQYADAIRAVAVADQSLGLLDLTSNGKPTGTGGGLYAASDGLHPSDAGQTAISAAVAAYLADQ
jgi:lysophospholipase L1-like esterase